MKRSNFYHFNNKKERRIYDISYKVLNIVNGVCEICGRNTYQDPSNIVFGDKVFHFDCVLNKIREIFVIPEDEKIIYLGSGNFGIFWESKSSKKLEILKKVNVGDVLVDYVK
ncbi:MAG: hypothetical protein ACP5PT_02885 [Brevinematia bacterium]